MTCNADVHGRPLAGALTMGGREFSTVAGAIPRRDPRRRRDRSPASIDAGTMALPVLRQRGRRCSPAAPATAASPGPHPDARGTPRPRRPLRRAPDIESASTPSAAKNGRSSTAASSATRSTPRWSRPSARDRRDAVQPRQPRHRSRRRPARHPRDADRPRPVPAGASPQHSNLPDLTAYRARWLDLTHQQTKHIRTGDQAT